MARECEEQLAKPGTGFSPNLLCTQVTRSVHYETLKLPQHLPQFLRDGWSCKQGRTRHGLTLVAVSLEPVSHICKLSTET